MDDATRTETANKYEELAEGIYITSTVDSLIGHIERQFGIACLQKLSRFNPKWSIWSGSMNRITRQRIKDKDPDSERLEDVFHYWQAVSVLLEMYFTSRSKLFGKNKIVKQIRKIKRMKEEILNG